MKEKVKNCLSRNFNCGFEHDLPKVFLISQWQQKDKNLLYVIYRCFLASFYIFSVCFSLTTSILRGEGKVHFVYLTNWNLFATMINQVIAAILVIQYHQNRMPIPDKMTLLMKIYWFFSISTTMYAILISMIYWGVLFKQDNNVIDLNNILIHGTNSLLLVIDIFIVKHRSNVSQFIWPLFCGIAYLILLTWFYTVVLGGVNRRGQNYIYPILNWNDKPLQAFYAAIGVTVSGAIIHTIIVFLQNVRVFIHKKLYHQKYKFVSNSNSSTRNDLAQIEAQYDKGEAPFILTY